MKLKECMMTNSTCYKQTTVAKKFTGIVVHDTGAGNPSLKRYVQPSDDDPMRDEILADIGKNAHKNDWNHKEREAGVHAFVGKNAAGEVETYQVLPFDKFAWGVGKGKYGSFNFDPTARIQFEICDDGYASEEYFYAAMREAQEYCAYLCAKFIFDPLSQICSHHESYIAGFGGNHADCDEWLKKFGKTMDWFRDEVKELLDEEYPYSVYCANGLIARVATKEEAFAYQGCRVYLGGIIVEKDKIETVEIPVMDEEIVAAEEIIEAPAEEIVPRKVQKGTIFRTIALVLAIVNQIVAAFGSTSFASATWYQVLSIILTAVTAGIAAWENNDFTYFARIGTGVLDALEDGKITVEEAKKLLEKSK